MTKKDFELLARTIANQRDVFSSNGMHAVFASELAHELAEENPRFDRSRFILACMPRTHVGTRHANVWERIARLKK